MGAGGKLRHPPAVCGCGTRSHLAERLGRRLPATQIAQHGKSALLQSADSGPDCNPVHFRQTKYLLSKRLDCEICRFGHVAMAWHVPSTGVSTWLSILRVYKVRSRPAGDCPPKDNSGWRGDESALKNVFFVVLGTWTPHNCLNIAPKAPKTHPRH